MQPQVFTPEFHLHTLRPFLSATAQLHHKVNIKQIVISLIDRLAAYAAREAESEDPEVIMKQEGAAAKRLAEKVRSQKAKVGQNEDSQVSPGTPWSELSNTWAAHTSPIAATIFEHTEPEKLSESESTFSECKGKEKEGPTHKLRGIPENVQLFEVFWTQVVQLMKVCFLLGPTLFGFSNRHKARPDLSIQDVTALLVSLTNLSVSCYPDRLEYVDQILGFAADKIREYSEEWADSFYFPVTTQPVSSPDLHTQQTAANLSALLVAPINSYQSVLTVLAIPNYVPLLTQQLFSTRRSIAHSIISSVLKNETIIETPEDADGTLELLHVLIKNQSDLSPDQITPNGQQLHPREIRKQGPYFVGREEVAEEQGWIARMVHLFRADSLDVQYEVCWLSSMSLLHVLII